MQTRSMSGSQINQLVTQSRTVDEVLPKLDSNQSQKKSTSTLIQSHPQILPTCQDQRNLIVPKSASIVYPEVQSNLFEEKSNSSNHHLEHNQHSQQPQQPQLQSQKPQSHPQQTQSQPLQPQPQPQQPQQKLQQQQLQQQLQQQQLQLQLQLQLQQQHQQQQQQQQQQQLEQQQLQQQLQQKLQQQQLQQTFYNHYYYQQQQQQQQQKQYQSNNFSYPDSNNNNFYSNSLKTPSPASVQASSSSIYSEYYPFQNNSYFYNTNFDAQPYSYQLHQQQQQQQKQCFEQCCYSITPPSSYSLPSASSSTNSASFIGSASVSSSNLNPNLLECSFCTSCNVENADSCYSSLSSSLINQSGHSCASVGNISGTNMTGSHCCDTPPPLITKTTQLSQSNFKARVDNESGDSMVFDTISTNLPSNKSYFNEGHNEKNFYFNNGTGLNQQTQKTNQHLSALNASNYTVKGSVGYFGKSSSSPRIIAPNQETKLPITSNETQMNQTETKPNSSMLNAANNPSTNYLPTQKQSINQKPNDSSMKASTRNSSSDSSMSHAVNCMDMKSSRGSAFHQYLTNPNSNTMSYQMDVERNNKNSMENINDSTKLYSDPKMVNWYVYNHPQLFNLLNSDGNKYTPSIYMNENNNNTPVQLQQQQQQQIIPQKQSKNNSSASSTTTNLRPIAPSSQKSENSTNISNKPLVATHSK